MKNYWLKLLALMRCDFKKRTGHDWGYDNHHHKLWGYDAGHHYLGYQQSKRCKAQHTKERDNKERDNGKTGQDTQGQT
jgi:hypothetical protein